MALANGSGTLSRAAVEREHARDEQHRGAVVIPCRDAFLTSALGLWKAMEVDDDKLPNAIADFDAAATAYMLAIVVDADR